MTTRARYGTMKLAPCRKGDKQVSTIEQHTAQDREMHCILYYYTIQRTILYTNNKASCYAQHTHRETVHTTHVEREKQRTTTAHMHREEERSSTHRERERERQHTQRKIIHTHTKRDSMSNSNNSTHRETVHAQRDSLHSNTHTKIIQQ